MDNTNINHYDVLWCVNKRRINMNKEREIAKFITVLDFEVGEVYQYKSIMCDFEEFITNKGHNLNNCQWMIHDNSKIIKS